MNGTLTGYRYGTKLNLVNATHVEVVWVARTPETMVGTTDGSHRLTYVDVETGEEVNRAARVYSAA